MDQDKVFMLKEEYDDADDISRKRYWANRIGTKIEELIEDEYMPSMLIPIKYKVIAFIHEKPRYQRKIYRR